MIINAEASLPLPCVSALRLTRWMASFWVSLPSSRSILSYGTTMAVPPLVPTGASWGMGELISRSLWNWAAWYIYLLLVPPARIFVSCINRAWYGLLFASRRAWVINALNFSAPLIPLTFLLSTRGPGCGSMPSSVRSRCHSLVSPAPSSLPIPPSPCSGAFRASTRHLCLKLSCVMVTSACSRGGCVRLRRRRCLALPPRPRRLTHGGGRVCLLAAASVRVMRLPCVAAVALGGGGGLTCVPSWRGARRTCSGACWSWRRTLRRWCTCTAGGAAT